MELKKQSELEELENLAYEWWIRCFGYATHGDTDVQLRNGATLDIKRVLADFAHQLPAQQEAAMLSRPDQRKLVQIAKALREHDPYRKALEDHMAVCNRPIVINLDGK